jgi:hypothetical protein
VDWDIYQHPALLRFEQVRYYSEEGAFFVSLLFTAHLINCAQSINLKNLSTGIRFKQVILKCFLRLDLQPVKLIAPTSITVSTVLAACAPRVIFFIKYYVIMVSFGN